MEEIDEEGKCSTFTFNESFSVAKTQTSGLIFDPIRLDLNQSFPLFPLWTHHSVLNQYLAVCSQFLNLVFLTMGS